MLQKIHVDNGCAGGHNGIHHIVFHQIDINLHAAAGGCRTGQCQDHRAVFFFQHTVVYIGGIGQIAGGKGHFFHRADDVHRVYFFNIDVFDLGFEKIFFVHDKATPLMNMRMSKPSPVKSQLRKSFPRTGCLFAAISTMRLPISA